jgi:hypothetical protein
MSTYTPPSGDAVDFAFEGSYTAPDGDNVNFLFGLVASIVSSFSLDAVYDEDGFDKVIIRWTSDIDGDYRVEMGGTGVNTGDLMASGYCIEDVEIENTVTYAEIAAAGGWTGVGTYRFNIYVKSSDDIWNLYE